MHELLESEHARTFVEGAEERGFVEPAEIEAFALEHDLGEEDAEQFQRELEAIGLEIRQPAEESGAKADKADEKAAEPQPPVHVVERQQKLGRAARRLEVELGREATKQELADATGLPLQHVDEALGAAQASVSLNQTVGADDEGELGDLFADREAPDPFDEAEESLRKQGVRRALDALPERERRILELRFGFDGE